MTELLEKAVATARSLPPMVQDEIARTMLLLAEEQMELSTRIDHAYRNSGNELGWRFLTSPAHVLEAAEVAFVGQNPGGCVRPPDHAEFAMPSGSAYVIERWDDHPAGESPLQRQVRTLFAGLNVLPENVLAGNLVPFRSPSWECLMNKQSAVRFGMELWREVLANARPRLVIGMGNKATIALAAILQVRDMETIPVEWGQVRATRGTFAGGTLIGLPHLSRYPIFNRPRSEQAIRLLLRDYWQK